MPDLTLSRYTSSKTSQTHKTGFSQERELALLCYMSRNANDADMHIMYGREVVVEYI